MSWGRSPSAQNKVCHFLNRAFLPIVIEMTRLKYGDMHHICQFSLCRLQVESRAIGREVQVWFWVLEKKSFFLCPFLVSTPLRSSSKSKIRSHKENEFFPSHFVAYLLQPCTKVVTTLYHGCYRVNYKAKCKVVTTMFHGCYNQP